MDAAKAMVDQFMQDRAEGRVQNAQARLTPAARAAFDAQSGPALDLEGLDDEVRFYFQSASSPGVGRYLFVFRVHRVAREAPHAAYWDETIQVLWQGGEYRVDGAALASGREASVGEDLMVRVRSAQGEEFAFGFGDLPDEFSPQGAPDDLAFGVGKEGYVLLSFSPAGDRLAFVTWGTHGFLGAAAMPQGEPRGIDLHFEGVTVDVEWAPDGQRLVAVVDEPTGNQALMLYSVFPPERLALGLRELFPPEQYSLSDPRWQQPGRLTFIVRAAEGGAAAREGAWQLDMGTGTVSRTGP